MWGGVGDGPGFEIESVIGPPSSFTTLRQLVDIRGCQENMMASSLYSRANFYFDIYKLLTTFRRLFISQAI